MKKFLSMMAIAAMLLGFASCGDDEPDNVDKFSSGLSGLCTKTSAGGQLLCDDECSTQFEIDYTNRVVDIKMIDVKFAPAMPDVPFELKGLKATIADRDHINVSGTGLQPMDGYTVNNLTGTINLALQAFYLRYTVTTNKGNFDVVTTSFINLSALPGGQTNYTLTNDKFYCFMRQSTHDISAGNGLSIYIYNISFAANMPTIDCRIPIDGANIISTATGFTATGTSILPYYMNGGDVEVPMPERQVDNLKLNVDLMNKKFNIEFDGFNDVHFTDSGTLYM